MGLLSIFAGKRNQKQADKETQAAAEVKKEPKKPLRSNTRTERIGYIKDNCEQIIESERQIEEAKAEYQAVTSYLTDMQKIDMIPLEQRGDLEDAARNILNLTKERGKLQNRSSILSDRQYKLYERYELLIPGELPQLKEAERYQSVIRQDMEHLEQERLDLDDDYEDITGKQAFLRGIAIIISIVVAVLFFLFGLITYYSETNLIWPFLLTVLMGMVLAFCIFIEARKNTAQVRLVQLKQNRQIMLMNKVKLKSVNNRNYLEYIYNKYQVADHEQLSVFWEEFVRLKDEARRYQANTDLIEFNNRELIRELKKFGIADAEIWIFQSTAILDNKEMVEVRHRLNVRRQKLRERIDVNTKQKQAAMKEIRTAMSDYPDCVEEAEQILRRYRIEMDM